MSQGTSPNARSALRRTTTTARNVSLSTAMLLASVVTLAPAGAADPTCVGIVCAEASTDIDFVDGACDENIDQGLATEFCVTADADGDHWYGLSDGDEIAVILGVGHLTATFDGGDDEAFCLLNVDNGFRCSTSLEFGPKTVPWGSGCITATATTTGLGVTADSSASSDCFGP